MGDERDVVFPCTGMVGGDEVADYGRGISVEGLSLEVVFHANGGDGGGGAGGCA